MGEREGRRHGEEISGGAGLGSGSAGIFGRQPRSATLARVHGSDAETRALAAALARVVGTEWARWQNAATVVDARVNGSMAAGGRLAGPPLSTFLTREAVRVDAEAGKALAAAIGKAHVRFTSTLSILGAPMFPSFAAYPAPFAPPTPSVPTPLLQTGLNAIAFASLGRSVRLEDPRKRAAVEAVLGSMFGVVTRWLGQTVLVMQGTGPVPTFAPPYVPVGPVVGGVANSVPGGLSGG